MRVADRPLPSSRGAVAPWRSRGARNRTLRDCFVASLLAMTAAVHAADATYPQRPIRFIMPYPVGGTIDMSGRLVAKELGDALGQQVVVDRSEERRVGKECRSRWSPY